MFDVQHNCTSIMEVEVVKIPTETGMAPTMLFQTGFSHNIPYTESTLLQVYQKRCAICMSLCNEKITGVPSLKCNKLVFDSAISGTNFT